MISDIVIFIPFPYRLQGYGSPPPCFPVYFWFYLWYNNPRYRKHAPVAFRLPPVLGRYLFFKTIFATSFPV